MPANLSDCVIPSTTVQLTGPLLIGSQLAWGLYGILGAQVYIYGQTSTIDSWTQTRGLVYASFLVQTAQVILASHDEFWRLGYSFGDFEGLTAVYTTWVSIPWLTGISSAAVQCFYAHHIHSLGRCKVLSMLIAASALLQCSAAIAAGIEILRYRDTLDMHKQTHNATLAWLGSNLACNILICFSLLYSRFKVPQPFSSGDGLLTKLRIVFVDSGLLTAILSGLALILLLACRRTFFYIAPALVLSKLTCISLLALLSNRIALRHSKRVPTSTFDFNSQATYARTSTAVEFPSSTYHTDTDTSISTNVLSTPIGLSAIAEIDMDQIDEKAPEEGSPLHSTLLL